MARLRIVVKGGEGSGHFGHAGRPGKRGGSLSGVASRRSGVASQSLDGDPRADKLLLQDDVQDWHTVSRDERGRIHADIANKLANDVDGDKYVVGELLHSWEGAKANSEHIVAIQHLASEELGLKLSDWQRAIQPPHYLMDRYSELKDAYRPYITSIYNNTQDMLRQAGFKSGDTIRLFRGMKLDDDFQPGESVDYRGNALESWTSDLGRAQHFSGMYTGFGSRVVFSMDVPIENVISTARSGFGKLIEGEFVITASNSGNTAKVVESRSVR